MSEREPSRELLHEAITLIPNAIRMQPDDASIIQRAREATARRLDALKADVAKAQAERDEAVGLLRQLRHCGMLPAKPYYRSDIDMLIQIDTFLAQHGGGDVE